MIKKAAISLIFSAIGLLILVVPGLRSNHLFGIPLRSTAASEKAVGKDGDIGKNIRVGKGKGYNGEIQLVVALDEQKRIASISVRRQDETKAFWKRLVDDGFLNRWNNLTLNEAREADFDAVTGATLSSNGVKDAVKDALGVPEEEAAEKLTREIFTFKNIMLFLASLTVLVLGIAAALDKVKFRNCRLFLSLAVLGFWGGDMLSCGRMQTLFSDGYSLSLANIFIVILFLAAVLVPFFTRKPGFYCTQICPFGAAQELAGKIPCGKKWTLPKLKYIGWGVAVVVYASMVSRRASLAPYEVFGAFKWRFDSINDGMSAYIVPILALTGIILSIKIPRCYCRGICPTGRIIKLLEVKR